MSEDTPEQWRSEGGSCPEGGTKILPKIFFKYIYRENIFKSERIQ